MGKHYDSYKDYFMYIYIYIILCLVVSIGAGFIMGIVYFVKKEPIQYIHVNQ